MTFKFLATYVDIYTCWNEAPHFLILKISRIPKELRGQRATGAASRLRFIMPASCFLELQLPKVAVAFSS